MAGAPLIATDRTEDRILFALKTHGPSSTAALARRMGISVPGVRQHLGRLAAAGLVSFDDRSAGVGRPARYWSLTEDANRIRQGLGEDALVTVIAHRHARMESRYGSALRGARGLRTRLERLAAARTADGYMAEVERSGDGWILAENHCPICAAAASCQGFCTGELELFRKLLAPAQVERTDHLLAGARRCAYRVTPGR